MDSNQDQTLESVTVDPNQLEQAMVEKALAEDPSGTPADKAAAFFQRSAHDLVILLDQMSLRAIKRMVMNVATYPYLDRDYTVKRGSVEDKASYRFNEMVWQKTIMQLQYEQEKVLKAEAEGKLNEESNLTLNKGEVVNGTEEVKAQ
jgi:hypothetical protein